MKKTAVIILVFFLTQVLLSASDPVRLLIVTGGHDYKIEDFNKMFSSLEPEYTFQVSELPKAFEMFLPENRKEYDVLVFYHMWQTIDEDEKKAFADCIMEGKPVVVLHHSICAFDDWPEYWNIIGGKYFHRKTTVNGTEYKPSSYIHDLHFRVTIVNPGHPVTKGVSDFDIFDETYKDYYIEEGVTPLLKTDEPSSNNVIGWTKKYGKSTIVVLQSGHDSPTFANPDFRKLLKQSIDFVYKKNNSSF